MGRSEFKGTVGLHDDMEEYHGHTPYELVYGKQVLLAIEFKVKTYRVATQLGMDLTEAHQQILIQLNTLDEIRHHPTNYPCLVVEK